MITYRKIVYFIFFLITLTTLWPLPGAEAPTAKRIVSISPVLTELVCFLGAESELVGRSSACDYPEEIKKLPIAGSFAGPSLEKIISLKCNMLLADDLQDIGMIKTFHDLKIDCQLLPLKKMSDYPAVIRQLGELLNRQEQAQNELKRYNSNLQKLLERQSTQPHELPKVLLLLWTEPLLTCGNESFLDEFITLSGGKNIAHDQKREYFNCSAEWVISANPDIIILAVSTLNGKDEFKIPPSWKELNAVKNDRIFMISNESLLCRLGPRMFDGIEELSRIIASE